MHVMTTEEKFCFENATARKEALVSTGCEGSRTGDPVRSPHPVARDAG
jgi:hypothetical protein